jgi:hypothetical protein
VEFEMELLDVAEFCSSVEILKLVFSIFSIINFVEEAVKE